MRSQLETREANVLIERHGVFIGGEWRSRPEAIRVDVTDPSTGEITGSVALADGHDVEEALRQAREAFDDGRWRLQSIESRAKALELFADRLDAKVDELAELNMRELGAPISMARGMQASPIGLLRVFAEELRSLPMEEERLRSNGLRSLVTREPVGVVSAIIPWNTPTNQFMFKVGPALAAGCSIIVKAATLAPLVVSSLADVIGDLTAEGVLPAGIFSLLVCRHDTAEPLLSDPRVDMVSFTGSTQAGRLIAAKASANLAKVTMELGGKSAAIVLDDADMDAVVATLPMSAVRNSGQTCVAITRVLVSNERHDELVARFVQFFEGVRVGSPSDPETEMGPLASEGALNDVLAYIDGARKEGAKVVHGGTKREGPGFYMEPTILDDVKTEMKVAQEELFGPVVSIITFEDEDDAVRIANDSTYGLSGAVFAGSQDRAISFARRIRSGVVGANCATFDASVPFGGMKASGVGREGGREGLEEFFELKTIHLAE